MLTNAIMLLNAGAAAWRLVENAMARACLLTFGTTIVLIRAAMLAFGVGMLIGLLSLARSMMASLAAPSDVPRMTPVQIQPGQAPSAPVPEVSQADLPWAC